MRLETIFFVLAAVLGLFWFQRLCDELLWVHKQQFEGKEIQALLADERGRRILTEVLSKNGALQVPPPEKSSTSLATQLQDASNLQDGDDGRCKKVLWFMGLRAEEASQFEYYRYLQVAMLSAKQAAPSLVPHLVFDGSPNEVTAWFERQGGRVILHELSIADTLKRAVEAGWQDAMWYRNRGAYLRLDIPLIFAKALEAFADDPTVETEYYLYTDNDVMFLRDINTCSFQPPPLFTIGAEHDRGLPKNTGVMYINAAGFAGMRDPLIDYGIKWRWNFTAMDQGLILEYMEHNNLTIPVLPDTFNWKGYWGGDDDVAIVHFHGPKPERCLPCLLSFPGNYWEKCTEQESCVPVHKYLFDKCMDRGMFLKQVMQEYYTLRFMAEHS